MDEAPSPYLGIGDVLVEVHAASFTPTELSWPSTWVDRAGRDRRPVIPSHEVSGVVTALDQSITASAGPNNSEDLTGLIQSNAPISPGDSGGALANASGQVIGMITAGAAGLIVTSYLVTVAVLIPLIAWLVATLACVPICR